MCADGYHHPVGFILGLTSLEIILVGVIYLEEKGCCQPVGMLAVVCPGRFPT